MEAFFLGWYDCLAFVAEASFTFLSSMEIPRFWRSVLVSTMIFFWVDVWMMAGIERNVVEVDHGKVWDVWKLDLFVRNSDLVWVYLFNNNGRLF